MKRIFALAMGLALLCGCGAVGSDSQDTTTQPVYTTMPSAHANTATPAPTDSEGEERFQLYAQLPKDDIYLYEIKGRNPQSGMVLFQGNSANYFSGWKAGRRFNDLVDIVYHDFDGDGKREIGVTTGIIAGGSGPSLHNLHILKVHEETPYPNPEIKTIHYTEYAFTCEDVTDYFKKRMTWKRGKEANTLELKIGGQTFLAQLRPDVVWNEEKGVVVDHRIHFDFREDGTIAFSGLALAWFTYSEQSQGLGYFNADVVFDGKEFRLINLAFGSYREN